MATVSEIIRDFIFEQLETNGAAVLNGEYAFILRPDLFSGPQQAFSASIRAIGEAYRLKNTEHYLNNTWNVEVVRSKIEEAKVRLQGQVSGAGVRNSAAQFGSNYYLSVISAALGSINTLASQVESS